MISSLCDTDFYKLTMMQVVLHRHAGACRALCEGEGKGLVFMIIVMGIVETVGLFGFVFLLLVLP